MRMMTARSLNEENIVVFFIATNVIVAVFFFFFHDYGDGSTSTRLLTISSRRR